MESATLQALLTALRKDETSLSSDVQSILQRSELQASKISTKELHAAVNRLDQAKKQWTLSKSARLRLHTKWRDYVVQSMDRWKEYVTSFETQDEALEKEQHQALDQLKAAREALTASKKLALETADGETTIVDDDEEDFMNDVVESGRGVMESLQSVVTTFEQLKHKADESVEQLQAAQGTRKIQRTAPATDGLSVPVDGPKVSTPSCLPFGNPGR